MTLYWKNISTDNAWENVLNWFTDAAATTQATNVPWFQADATYLSYDLTRATGEFTSPVMDVVGTGLTFGAGATGVADFDNILNNGAVSGGNFSGANFANAAYLGVVNGGTFSGAGFTNNYLVTGGTFSGAGFTNNETVMGGTFSGAGFTNSMTIQGGTFSGANFVNAGNVIAAIFTGSAVSSVKSGNTVTLTILFNQLATKVTLSQLDILGTGLL